MTEDEYADSLLEELDEAKESSGYNAYLESRKDSQGYMTHHWTFNAYLKRMRILTKGQIFAA